MLVWSGGSSTTKDSGVTSEISFVSNGILIGENQLSKMEFKAWLLNIGFDPKKAVSFELNQYFSFIVSINYLFVIFVKIQIKYFWYIIIHNKNITLKFWISLYKF